MCNIAGYVGKKAAAPILIEMLRRQEGIDAGYYTGIATIHEGKIHYRKLCGDLDSLLKSTDAASLPGNIGIIHGRTKSGGPDEWSHPFISRGKADAEPTVAYVANGNSGIFKSRDPEYNILAEDLIKDGYRMDSEIELEDGIYNRLSNGKMVHMSDVMCALIAKEIDLGRSEDVAMANAFTTMPGDIVGLLLSISSPDKIFWSKISRPMNLAFAEHGAYLATTTIAFPEDAKTEPVRLPYLSAGYVTSDSFFSRKYEEPPADIVIADLGLKAKIYEATEKLLSDGAARHIYEVNASTAKILKRCSDKLSTVTPATYEALEALYHEGKIELVKETTEGVKENDTAPYYRFKIKG